jgi:transcriptional regulator with XRE-family HTH domain
MAVNPDIRRKQLSELLKGCRARVSPTQMGLPDQQRRRTSGLRREDVAALAGVSVTWYTWLEQARDIKVSAELLNRISSTLQMSTDERDYLFALVQHRAPPHSPMGEEPLNPALQRMLDALNVPALIKTARWDVIAWNELMTRVFRDYGRLPPGRRNLLRLLLVDETMYHDPPDAFYTTARRILSKFRVDYSQYPDDPAFDELVEGLRNDSPIFEQLWGSPEVMNRSEAIAYHPQHGGMWFEHTSYVPEGSPMLRAVIFVPHDSATANLVAAMQASIEAETRAAAASAGEEKQR